MVRGRRRQAQRINISPRCRSPTIFRALRRILEIAIFRIVQEALTNVFRHSEASRSWVILSREGKSHRRHGA